MKRIPSALFALILCLALLPTTALADTGPKPQLTITVVNPPEWEYYLDLLIPEQERGGHDNLGDGPYNSLALQGLHAWESEGWYPALAGGTKAPLFGSLTPDENGTHTFSYFGLPQTFRIATSDYTGGCVVRLTATEEPFTRTTFYTNLTYDYATGSITHSTPVFLGWALQFLATLVPTLLIEGAVLLLFRFKFKENRRVFLLVNLLTQLGLHLVIGGTLPAIGRWFTGYLLLLLPLEAAVFALEAAAYAFLLKGHTKPRRVLYALTANALSYTATFFTLRPVLEILKRL